MKPFVEDLREIIFPLIEGLFETERWLSAEGTGYFLASCWLTTADVDKPESIEASGTALAIAEKHRHNAL